MFQATDIKVNDVDFNPEFIKRMIPKLEWDVICDAAESVSDSVLLMFRLLASRPRPSETE